MVININTRASVILTQSGAEVINKYNLRYHLKSGDEKYFPTNYKEGDKISTKLWEIMKIFGSQLGMGCEIPFKFNEIELE